MPELLTILETAPDPSALGGDLLLGPLTLTAFIIAALGYAAKEYRAARTARVDDAEKAAATAIAERDDARDNADQVNQRLDAMRGELAKVKESNVQTYEALYERHNEARRMLLDRGVPLDQLP